MISGKAFEFALLIQFEEKLTGKTKVEVIKNNSFEIAKNCFELVTGVDQSEYSLAASFAVNFLMDIEPRLSHEVNPDDTLQLEILTDHQGKSGDVRDVLAIRLMQKWEIGVSAKNNHKAVKHSRLSSKIDFAEKWLGLKASEKYFATITPIFDNLAEIKKRSQGTKKWSDLGDYHQTIYFPILEAFINELVALNQKHPTKVAPNLVKYLVGNKDFYKVIKSKNKVAIHAYNLHGTLNLPFKDFQPKYKTPLVPLPTEIEKIVFKKDSQTTVIVTMDQDWTLSFRIHNASSKIEPSLKFDINLLKSPDKLFTNTLNIT